MNKKIIVPVCLLMAMVWTVAGCECMKARPAPPPPPPVAEPAPYVAPPPPPPEVVKPAPVVEPAPTKKLKERVIKDTND